MQRLSRGRLGGRGGGEGGGGLPLDGHKPPPGWALPTGHGIQPSQLPGQPGTVIPVVLMGTWSLGSPERFNLNKNDSPCPRCAELQ